MSENAYLTGVHSGLGDVRHASLRNTIGNACMIKAAVAMDATTKNTVDSAAFTYTIGGKYYSKSALADAVLTVTDAYDDQFVQQQNQTCYYALCINAAGTVSVYKGGAGKGLPQHPADLCCFCVLKVVTVAATFTLGTTLLDAAGVTATFHDCQFLPATAP